MLKTDENEFFETAVFHSTGYTVSIRRVHFISGGYGNNVVKLETSQGDFCVKWHENLPQEAFEAQLKDMQALNSLAIIQTPQPIGTGKIDSKAYVLMEDIGFHIPKDNFWEMLGEQLALLHANTHKSFGWSHNNWLHNFELNNQSNTNWNNFYFENRLKPLFSKAYFDGKLEDSVLRKLDLLQEKTAKLFPKEPPALVHGNLYRDNIIAGDGGTPILQSPIPYFGNRELELLRLLFLGDIPESFFEVYQSTFPLSNTFEERKPLYQLYVLGQYINQFGASYLTGVEKVFKRFL